jgi:hypothetical protein
MMVVWRARDIYTVYVSQIIRSHGRVLVAAGVVP